MAGSMKAKTLAVVAIATLALSACGGGGEPETTATSITAEAPAQSPEPEAVSAQWDEIPGGGETLKQFIDEDAAAGDCESLQGFFDVWINYKTPEGLHLMDVVDYIDDSMREAGCYE